VLGAQGTQWMVAATIRTVSSPASVQLDAIARALDLNGCGATLPVRAIERDMAASATTSFSPDDRSLITSEITRLDCIYLKGSHLLSEIVTVKINHFKPSQVPTRAMTESAPAQDFKRDWYRLAVCCAMAGQPNSRSTRSRPARLIRSRRPESRPAGETSLIARAARWHPWASWPIGRRPEVAECILHPASLAILASDAAPL
jgi:hypothetical protein